jgi:hypothetical protein
MRPKVIIKSTHLLPYQGRGQACCQPTGDVVEVELHWGLGLAGLAIVDGSV